MVKKYDLRTHPLYTRLPEYKARKVEDARPGSDKENGEEAELGV